MATTTVLVNDSSIVLKDTLTQTRIRTLRDLIKGDKVEITFNEPLQQRTNTEDGVIIAETIDGDQPSITLRVPEFSADDEELGKLIKLKTIFDLIVSDPFRRGTEELTRVQTCTACTIMNKPTRVTRNSDGDRISEYVIMGRKHIEQYN